MPSVVFVATLAAANLEAGLPVSAPGYGLNACTDFAATVSSSRAGEVEHAIRANPGTPSANHGGADLHNLILNCPSTPGILDDHGDDGDVTTGWNVEG